MQWTQALSTISFVGEEPTHIFLDFSMEGHTLRTPLALFGSSVRRSAPDGAVRVSA